MLLVDLMVRLECAQLIFMTLRQINGHPVPRWKQDDLRSVLRCSAIAFMLYVIVIFFVLTLFVYLYVDFKWIINDYFCLFYVNIGRWF